MLGSRKDNNGAIRDRRDHQRYWNNSGLRVRLLPQGCEHEDRARSKLDTKIDKLDEKVNTKIDKLDEKVNTKIDKLDEKVNTLTASVAAIAATQAEHGSKLQHMMGHGERISALEGATFGTAAT